MEIEQNIYNEVSEMFEQSANIDNAELEALFYQSSLLNMGSYQKNIPINRKTFERAISMMRDYEYEESVTEQLDIGFKKHRVSVYGEENINRYCQKNKIYKDMNIEVVEKSKITDIDVSNYNFRINLKQEKKINDEDDIEDIIDEINVRGSTKNYRLKKRLSFADELFRLDFTVVKESNKGKFTKSTSIVESGLVDNPETFEIELEYVGGEIEDVEFLTTLYISRVEETLKAIEGSDFILTNDKKSSILAEYQKLIDMNPVHNMPRWIGPQPVSLDMASVSKLKENYTVTEKADGERCILFIDSEGDVYRINNRFGIVKLGVTNKTHPNTIIDGEYVERNKLSQYEPLYLAFDLYYLKGEDVRELPLMETDNEKTRLSLLQQINDWEYPDDKEMETQFIVKTFYDKDMFKSSKQILAESQSSKMNYKIDGLIFTPSKLQVSGDEQNQVLISKEQKKVTGVTWDLCYKWKPEEDNTIDFLVKTNDEIKYNAKGAYKTLHLLCSNSNKKKQKTSCFDIFADTSDNEKRKIEDLDDNSILFQPEDEEGAFICNLYLKDEENNICQFAEASDGKMFAKDGDEILNGMVVEMAFDKNEEVGWFWKPRNIRHDKNKGNFIDVAKNVWRTIHNPVTKEIITTGKIPDMSDEIYYAKDTKDRQKSHTMKLREFHNKYIKRRLLEGVSKEKQGGVFYDMCCGRGGDIAKWMDLGFKFILGLDNSRENLEGEGGACSRYKDAKKKNNDTKSVFVWGDASELLIDDENNTNAGNDKVNKEILDVLWGKSDKYPNVNGICEEGFDVMSCQFSIHYLMDSIEKLSNLIKNISNHLKQDGYFVGTCFDGKTLFEVLNKNNKLESKDKKGNVIWQIVKKYEEEVMVDTEESLGMKIDVYMDSIGKMFSENLVNFDYFNSAMNKNGLFLVDNEELKDMGLKKKGFESSTGMFSDVYEKVIQNVDNKKKINMSEDEKKYSFLNRYFIYKKKLSVV